VVGELAVPAGGAEVLLGVEVVVGVDDVDVLWVGVEGVVVLWLVVLWLVVLWVGVDVVARVVAGCDVLP